MTDNKNIRSGTNPGCKSQDDATAEALDIAMARIGALERENSSLRDRIAMLEQRCATGRCAPINRGINDFATRSSNYRPYH